MTPAAIGLSLLVVAAATGVIWFRRRRSAEVERRMRGMMARVGMDFGTEPSDESRKRAALKETRRRCLKCARDAHCDRWLAGEAEGDSAFCPNAQTFRDSLDRDAPAR